MDIMVVLTLRLNQNENTQLGKHIPNRNARGHRRHRDIQQQRFCAFFTENWPCENDHGKANGDENSQHT